MKHKTGFPTTVILALAMFLPWLGCATDWLTTASSPARVNTTASPPMVNSLLTPLGGNFRPLVCAYDGNRLGASHAFSWSGMNGRIIADGAEWRCTLALSNLPSATGDALEMDLRFTLVSGSARSAGVAAAFDFASWSTNNYVLIPAAVYAGNRFRVYPAAYPPYIRDEKDRPLDMPVTITDQPHLELDGSPAKIELNTGNATTPAMCFFDPKARLGFMLLTEQGTRFGNSGLSVEENAAQKRATFVVSAPGVREGTGDRGVDWNAGDSIVLKLRVQTVKAADIPAFLAKVFEARKALSGPNEFRCLVPFSQMLQWECNLQDSGRRWYQDHRFGYYKNGNGDSPYGHIQLGWVGGLMNTYPMLLPETETPERLRRVASTFDTVRQFMRGDSGLLYGINRRGENVSDNFGGANHDVAMVRKNGDGLYYALQQFMLLQQRGHADMVRPEWDAMMRGVADGMVKLWQDYGQFGQFVDVKTGRLEINGSTAGAQCVSALALAAKYFHEPKYLAVAKLAGEFYYDRDVRHGYTTGGPGEILQCPDSESAFALLEGLVALHEVTGQSEWIGRARDAANLCATWVVSYDYLFPPASDLARVGAHSTGAVWASIANKHGAPGICSASGDCLLKLYRATGDQRYAALLRDIAHNIIEFVTFPGHPLGHDSGPGFVMERVNLSDWEGQAGVGRVQPNDTTSWCEVAVMLTCMEIPGLYLRTDAEDFFVFDHVEAKVLERSRQGVLLEMTNPTAFAAKVSILAESSTQARRPLGWNAFLKWPRVELEPRATRRLWVKPDGTIDLLP